MQTIEYVEFNWPSIDGETLFKLVGYILKESDLSLTFCCPSKDPSDKFTFSYSIPLEKIIRRVDITQAVLDAIGE